MWKNVKRLWNKSIIDEDQRKIVVFYLLNIVLAGVALLMTAVNLRTGEWELMWVTAGFAALCLLNCLFLHLSGERNGWVFTVFSVEAMVLLVYFVLSGIPDGFSVLWTLLVPAFSLMIFGQKIGIRFSVLTFFMVIFFFWLPFGQKLLYYDYDPTFMLRFPIVYACLFVIALYVNSIRLSVYRKLSEAQAQARYLYRHDALTGIYSRHAFYEELRRLYDTPSNERAAVLMVDIDDFKQLNDLHGHNAGDEVLKILAQVLLDNICEHCLACRWGGEEFLVLMRCGHDPFAQAELIRKKVEALRLELEGQELRFTVSVGVAVAKELRKEQLHGLIDCADMAMYASKQGTKNRTTLVEFAAS